MRRPASFWFVKEPPQLQLPEPRALDARSLIQADVETELVVVDSTGLERLTHRHEEGINVEGAERSGGDPSEFGHEG